MVRIFIVKKDTDLQSLSTTLLDARFRSTQADAAIEQLRALNPHADLESLKSGTVLLVPDSPGFKLSATALPEATPLDDFRTLVTRGLRDAASRMSRANAARADERAEVADVLKSAVFKRIVGNDKDLAQQADDARKALASEESDDKQAEETLAVASRAALAAFVRIGKLVG
jgi:hypothetical protein